jgi:hypothetical protein
MQCDGGAPDGGNISSFSCLSYWRDPKMCRPMFKSYCKVSVHSRHWTVPQVVNVGWHCSTLWTDFTLEEVWSQDIEFDHTP